MKRVKSVDILRGIAVLWMVTFQTFDFFSMDFKMYGDFFYIFLNSFNWLSIFMLVSGVSLWLMVNKRLQESHSKTEIFLNGLKRYGFYLVLSFFLSLWCFNFDTFFKLNEILGAIAIYALASLVLLLVFYKVEFSFLPLMFLIFSLSFWAKDFFSDRFFPFWFILPFFLVGMFLSKLVLEKKVRRLLLFNLLLLPIMFSLVFLGDNISYVDKSLSFVVFNVFVVVPLFVLVIWFENSKFLGFFSFVGKHALFFYVFHYAIWFKLLVFFNMFQSFNQLNSVLLTFLATATIFVAARMGTIFNVKTLIYVNARNLIHGRWGTNIKYAATLILVLLLIIVAPLMMPRQTLLDGLYLHSIKGVLSTDSYCNYPYKTKDLEIGFSRYGELVTPQNTSYTEENWLTGRGLSYDSYEAFAIADNQNEYYPLEGWFLKYSYLDYSTNTTKSDLAYALYSDLDKKISEGGRTKNLLAEPIKIIYDGARRFVAQATVHILQHHKNIIDLEQTLLFNKVSKHVIVLMDVKFLEPAGRVGPLRLNISRRTSFKLAQSLITKQGQFDNISAHFWRSIPTVYRYPDWLGHNETGYYTLIAVSTESQMGAGSGYTGFAAYWPNVTDSRIYGWDEWNQTISGHQTPSPEPRGVLLIGEWDNFVLPESTKRFVIVYGIVDGTSPEDNQELQFQLNMVFNPWSLRNAIETSVTYQYILVGHDLTPTVLDASALLRQHLSVESLGFDIRNPISPESPYLFHLAKDTGEKPDDFRDCMGRLHFKEKWNEKQIAGSNLIVLGRPSENLGSEYFNDYTSAFMTTKGIYVPSCWSKTLYSSGLSGYAVISASRDLNDTAALVIWGVTFQDTYYASFILANGLLEELQAIPTGITTIVLKFNYSFSPAQSGFSTIIERLGTITEFGVNL